MVILLPGVLVYKPGPTTDLLGPGVAQEVLSLSIEALVLCLSSTN